MDARRRQTLGLFLAACAARAGAQPASGTTYRLAWLSGSAVIPGPVYNEFVAAMRELGWHEGRHYVVENLRYEGQPDRLPAIAADVVARKFDLIICAGTPPAIAAQRATSTIPIVFYFVGDPVGAGLVATIGRPGRNATGLGGLGVGIYAKMLELLLEAAPKASRIAIVHNPTFSLHTNFRADIATTAQRAKITLLPVELRSADEIDSAMAAIARDKPHALMILGQPFLVAHGARFARFALEHRLPTMVPFEGVVHDGILMSYGSRFIDDVRRVPYYVDRILNGTSPASLPVEQATRFYLTINAKTAKAIGLALPASLLQRADQVVE
jgi:putative ABC transport system substrate-binding protein